MQLRIPKKVKIGLTSYKIELVIKHPEKGVAASINYDTREIVVATHSNTTGKPFSGAYVVDSYVHELTHAILTEMGHKQARTEAFVRPFASHLTKALFKP